MRLRFRLLSTLICTGVSVSALLGPMEIALAQSAASIVEIGWWTRNPNPSAAQEGGFEVARAPDGDFSVAALRIRVDATSLTKALLILNESGGVRQDGAALKVCATSAAWSAANPGPMSASPAPGCDRGNVQLQRDAVGTRWTGDISVLLSGPGSPLSVVVLPDPPAPNPLPDPGFQIDFSNAQLAAEGSFEQQGSFPASSGFFPSGSTFVVPPDQLFPLPAPAEVAPALPEPSATEDSRQLVAAPTTDGGEDIPWHRLLVVIPGSLAVGAAAAAGRHWLLLRGLKNL